jgi:hypothetical protein
MSPKASGINRFSGYEFTEKSKGHLCASAYPLVASFPVGSSQNIPSSSYPLDLITVCSIPEHTVLKSV